MNPKGVNDLDPKLRETYERVMGTSLQPAPPAANNPIQTPTQQTTQPPPQPVFKTEAVAPEPTVQVAVPVAPPAPEMIPSPQVFKASDPFKDIDPPPAEVLANNAVVPSKNKKKSKLKPFLFVTVGLVFFVVYAVVWAKVFGLF